MFSTENRYQSRKELLDAVIALSDEEKAELATVEKTITSGPKRKRFELTRDVLANFNDINKLFKFCFNSDIFKNYCLKNEFKHMDTWVNVLRILKYSGEEIRSVDGKETISIFDQYLGAFFYGEYLDFKQGKKKMLPSHAVLYLDLACEMGLFQALVARCEYNKEKIHSSRVTNEVQTDSLAQIKSDTKQLSNLYWAVGCLHAALVQLDIGNYFANQATEESTGIAYSFQKSAAKKFLKGRELSAYNGLLQNEKILKEICGKKGLLVFEFDGWDSAQQFFLKHVNNNFAPHDALIIDAKTEIRKFVNFSRHLSSS
jgi:hypothetical protein